MYHTLGYYIAATIYSTVHINMAASLDVILTVSHADFPMHTCITGRKGLQDHEKRAQQGFKT